MVSLPFHEAGSGFIMKIGQMLLFNNHGRKESKTGFSWAHTVCQVPSYTLSWLILWGNGTRVQASLFLFHLWGNWLSERKGDLPKVIMASRFRTQTRICMQRLCSSHLTWFLRAKSPSDFSTAIELYKKQSFSLTKFLVQCQFSHLHY